MSPFTGPFPIEPDENDPSFFRTLAPITFRLRWGCLPKQQELIIIPTGTMTDFASVPRLAQCIVPKIGRHSRSVVLHDYLCTTGGDRFLADAILRVAMKEDGVNWFLRQIIYFSVRAYSILARKS